MMYHRDDIEIALRMLPTPIYGSLTLQIGPSAKL